MLYSTYHYKNYRFHRNLLHKCICTNQLYCYTEHLLNTALALAYIRQYLIKKEGGSCFLNTSIFQIKTVVPLRFVSEIIIQFSKQTLSNLTFKFIDKGMHGQKVD